MLIAVHSVAGGIAGGKLGNPVLAFLIGFILHFIFDAIPHEYRKNSKKMSVLDWGLLAIDCIITIIVWKKFFLTEISPTSSFFWGALGGIFPDLMDNVPVLKEYFRKTTFGKKFHSFHKGIQQVIVGVFWGRVIEYFILFLLLWSSKYI